MPEQTQRLVTTKNRGSSWERRTDPDSRAFYQSYKWRKFRRRVKIKRRKMDEDRVHDLYKDMTKTTFESLIAWQQSDNPLCVDCIDDGYIRQGSVADHIERIRAGGKAYDEKNIAFRCHHHHNVKSGKESHE